MSDQQFSVLMYHSVWDAVPAADPYHNGISTATFDSHLRWLINRGYQPMSLSALEEVWEGGRLPPTRGVAITFDDGYEDNYLHAWPILRRHQFTATIFVVTDTIGGVNAFDSERGVAPARMLTTEQIRTLHRGGVSFGSHGCSHPATLTALADDRLDDEVNRSRRELEQLLDAPVHHFSYPHSKSDDRVEDAVCRAGYRLACTGEGGPSSRYRVHRVQAPAFSGPAVEFAMRRRNAKLAIKRLAGSFRRSRPGSPVEREVSGP